MTAIRQLGTFGELLGRGGAGERVAVVDGGRSWSYGALADAGHRLARELVARGAGPETVVLVALPRSVELVRAVWAVAATGAAILPVDLRQPPSRRGQLLAEAGARIGITTRAVLPGLPRWITWIVLDDEELLRRCAEHDPAPLTDADRLAPTRLDQLAYVLSTSGSTGAPKAVAVTHRGLGTLLAEVSAALGPLDDARVLQIASPGFDLFVNELLLAFAHGATLVIVPPEITGGGELDELIAGQAVTHVIITPAVLATLDPRRHTTLRGLLVGGDASDPALIARWAPGRTYVNGYGPTETTVFVTARRLLAGDPVALGAVFDGWTAQVLDERLRPVPAGVPGELYLSGPGVARGYRRAPGATAARFVAGPSGTRRYRTGDLVRSDAEGNLEFLGRTDFQLKVLGIRLEPGEIDAVLTAHAGIRAAVTIGCRNPAGALVPVSYVAAEPGHTVDVPGVLAFARERLARHAVPSAVVVLDELPLTSVGKVDRAALPAPTFATGGGAEPADAVERLVSTVMTGLLGTPVGAHDDFFALGGNSLLAAQLGARLGAATGKHVPVRAVFDAPTAARLAATVRTLSRTAPRPPVTRRERPATLPLAPAQRRLWVLNRIDHRSPADNIALAVRVRGPLAVAALRAALDDVIERHEPLRTLYPEVDGVGVQRVLPIDSARGALDRVTVDPAGLDAALAEFGSAGFDLTSEPPLRARLFAIGPDEHVLALVVHHISADGWSLGPLARDLFGAYAARRHGGLPEFAPLPAAYADYALAQHDWITDQTGAAEFDSQLRYWRARLAGLAPRIDLPADRPLPAVASGAGAVVTLELGPELASALRRLAVAHGATQFMVVHAILAVALSRSGAGGDIAIGTPVAGRGGPELDDLVGMFVNMVVLRTTVDSADSFTGVLTRVRDIDLGALANADLPFERVVEAIDPPRTRAYHPLFQVVLTAAAAVDTATAGLAVEPVESSLTPAKFDLQLTMSDPGADTIALAITYATDLFDRATIELFADTVERVARAVAAAPAATVGDIDLADASAPAASPADRRDHRTLNDLFDVAAHRHASATAVRAGTTTLTYRQLDDRSAALAQRLEAAGAGPERRVAIRVGRSAELIVAVLAVIRSGAAYVPIDPESPRERIDYLLADARPVCVIEDGLVVRPVDGGGQAERREAADGLSDRASDTPVRAENVAYVIYTSGSTGAPKGVAVEHRQIVALLERSRRALATRPTDVWALFHSAAFDFAVWEMWGALTTGAALVVVDRETARSPERLREMLGREQVSVLGQTPSAFAGLDEADARATANEGVARGRADQETSSARRTPPRATHGAGRVPEVRGEPEPAHGPPAEYAPPPLRRIVFGGEPLDPRRLTSWLDRHGPNEPRLVNMYGITETTVHVTHTAITDGEHHRAGSPIGRPLDGLTVQVLDARLHPVPTGVVGEIYVGGAQVTRGYLHRPGLTATRFVADPRAVGRVLYRSGDLGRWNREGGLEHFGRADRQVKIRGYRIEPAEIEVALLKCPGVAAAVVVVHDDPTRGQQLVGYVVTARGAEITGAAVRARLRNMLPEYQIPSAVMVIDALPLTPNGKLALASLPTPEFGSDRAYREPEGATERTIAAVFAELLGADRVGADDSFFDLGGNSILATRVVSRLRAELSAEVALAWLFSDPTPAELARRVAEGSAESALAPVLTLRGRGRGAPLFCVHPVVGLAWSFAGLSAELSCPIYGLQSPAIAEDTAHPESIEAMAADYVTRIRAVQPHGPYRLLGWCVGGVIAHAMAVRLRELGERVEVLAMLDSFVGDVGYRSEVPVTVGDLLGQFGTEHELATPVTEFTPADAVTLVSSLPGPFEELTEERVHRLFAGILHTQVIGAAHRPRVYDGDLLFFTADRDDRGEGRVAVAWRDHIAGDIRDVPVDATHWDITGTRALTTVGPALAEALDGRPRRTRASVDDRAAEDADAG
ncbi:non-ribosomal peptide synthetase [Nocardia neocaledoniensis]|uniref:non-ribosomal peptide synthetase n=1 Tax=Nocardia neocaledoniensis TaxID=236511 RepID=UPI00245599B9|nr:non-ribosomal peptide synthetase [Nocardia neocaledoniensis]